MVIIIQISDLHYGSEFEDSYFNNVIDYIKQNKHDVVVLTGDIVHKGRYRQYQRFSAYLQKLKDASKRLLVVPGNHCAKNNGLIFFEKFIAPRRSKMILEDRDTIIVGVCSAKDDVSTGEIGDEQLDWLGNQFVENLENRVIAMHHHAIAVPYSGRKQTTLVDAGELIEFTQLFGIDLVLMGHKHIPHAYVIGPTTFLYCGTSTSNKVRADEGPSFNHIWLNEGDLEVQMVNSTTLQRSLLLERKNNRTKFVRPRRTRIEHLINSKVWDD
ncbi:MAG: metallophosphoesterase [Candidatus Lokiarchaeota archaeon]|nr:metallophosphoesterase [Candidatus Lokiarchaeota archaeon]